MRGALHCVRTGADYKPVVALTRCPPLLQVNRDSMFASLEGELVGAARPYTGARVQQVVTRTAIQNVGRIATPSEKSIVASATEKHGAKTPGAYKVVAPTRFDGLPQRAVAQGPDDDIAPSGTRPRSSLVQRSWLGVCDRRAPPDPWPLQLPWAPRPRTPRRPPRPI